MDNMKGFGMMIQELKKNPKRSFLQKEQMREFLRQLPVF